MASHKINAIEGIGDSFAGRFRTAGIRSVKALLEQGGTRAGRRPACRTPRRRPR